MNRRRFLKRSALAAGSLQYFGLAKIDGATEVLTVSLNDLTGKTLYSVDVQPA